MKKTVLFGSGVIAEKNFHLKPEFIVDNNPDLIGTTFHDYDIKAPQEIEGLSDQYSIIICTSSVREVKQQLVSYGFEWGVNINVAEQLREKLAISDLEEQKFKFLISSGLPSSATSFSGGGVHLVEETEGDFPAIRNIYEGNTHGLIRFEDGFAFTCQGRGIVLLDNQCNEVKEIPLRSGLRPHGIKRYNDLWVLVCSYADCILAVDDSGNEVFEYPLSDKLAVYESAQHHCNDIEIVGDYAYVSMFSVTGNWKRSFFDGGIVEIHLKTGERTVIVNNLTMPHSITEQESGIYILDSFTGRLLGPNMQELAQLPGFARGFDSNDTYYFIGESKNRNFSRLDTKRSPVSVDSRITIINKQFSFSRSVPLPMRISEIHSVILL